MDALAALRLQLEWGADEALLDAPVNRMVARQSAAAAVVARPAVAVAGVQREPPPPPPRPAPSPSAGLAPRVPLAEQAASLAAATPDEAALEAAIRAFDPDGLAATAMSFVRPAGAAAFGLALVGDVPGADEDRSGVPFAGAAGALLDRMLGSIGLSRDNLLLAHVLPWRPPGGRPASEGELAAYLPFLQRLLVLRRVRRLVLFGTGPLRALCGREATLARARGRWRAVSIPGAEVPVEALPTLAPNALLDRPELKAAAWRDLRLLRRTLVDT